MLRPKGEATLDHGYGISSSLPNDLTKVMGRPLPAKVAIVSNIHSLPPTPTLWCISYCQRLNSGKPQVRAVRFWNHETTDKLQGCLVCSDCEALTASCDNDHEQMEVITPDIGF